VNALVRLVLALTAAAPLFAAAQQTTPPSTTQTSAAAKSHSTAGLHVRTISPTPASARPPRKVRPSTAEDAAVRGQHPPLKALPAFNVNGRDGLAVSSQTLSRQGHWLLILRRDKCIPCDRLMNAIATGNSVQPGGGQAYAVIVVGRQKDGLDTVHAAYSPLANATWVGDTQGQALAAFKPHGYPMLYAMDGSRIAWSVPGTLGDPARVEQRAAAWVAVKAPAAAATTSSSTTTPAASATPAAAEKK
jgi:hypothetical protein